MDFKVTIWIPKRSLLFENFDQLGDNQHQLGGCSAVWTVSFEL